MKSLFETLNSALNEGRGTFGEYVDQVTDKFNEFYHANKKKVDDYIEIVKASGEVVKSLDVRIAWDIARACKYRNWDFFPQTAGGYIDATDAQLNTLFLQALKKSDIKL